MAYFTSKNGGKCCFWCGKLVTDGSKESGWTGLGPDWMDDGDFGCGGSPITGEDGCGGHMTIEEIKEIIRIVELEECGQEILTRMRANLYVRDRLLGVGR